MNTNNIYNNIFVEMFKIDFYHLPQKVQETTCVKDDSVMLIYPNVTVAQHIAGVPQTRSQIVQSRWQHTQIQYSSKLTSFDIIII